MSPDSFNPVLSTQECWSRLAQEEFGRLGYHLADEVHIAPVNYAVDGQRLVFRTAEGSKLLGVVMNDDVAFEVDRVLEEEERAWSVLVRGRASLLEGDAALDVDNLRLRPWVSTNKFNVVSIAVDEISGRDYPLSRPWQQLIPEDE
ncbi:MAG: pyridoxamine 5'-phosphate oxidase family protein [Ornithinimicrobium sp.]|uniref:pyridoxamine 5'-phosphate oxidase family protein n=1 Tax=Ornithinimicrobium sp. TaxID=1977084 RepID=UPI0026E02A07|nr:pyridoxamine 5'-phosphate oxidase family protein [Ornithinimicrobium sp.]MDO5739026.1 pyridoxamine 5'-phosphate oxidase family protein [Ornithinimicrobium sp.]